MEHLFAYGTLMCEDIMENVSTCRLSHAPAILKGYRRLVVKGEHYPAIIPHNESRVEGMIYWRVPDSAWQRLDRFEGEMYARLPVQIELQDGAIAAASTYVVQPAFRDHLAPFDWDFDAFLRNGKANFLKQYKGYAAL